MAEQERISMDDILGGKEPAPREPAAPPPAPAAKAPLDIPVLGDTPLPDEPKVERAKSSRAAHRDKEQDAQGRVRDPVTGQFSAKVEAPTADPAKPEAAPAAHAKPAPVVAPQQEMTDKEKAFLRAAQEERGKRQELERRIAAIEAAKTQPAAAPTDAAKTFWDDPEGALAKHRDEIRAEATHARLNTSEFIARQKHTDFDEKVAVFAKVLQQTPGLHQQWLAAPDPAEFAYSLGKNHMELQEAGSIDGLRAKIEKETRIKLEAELREKADALAKERAALPPSLSEARSTGANKPTWGGVPSFDEILKG